MKLLKKILHVSAYLREKSLHPTAPLEQMTHSTPACRSCSSEERALSTKINHPWVVWFIPEISTLCHSDSQTHQKKNKTQNHFRKMEVETPKLKPNNHNVTNSALRTIQNTLFLPHPPTDRSSMAFKRCTRSSPPKAATAKPPAGEDWKRRQMETVLGCFQKSILVSPGGNHVFVCLCDFHIGNSEDEKHPPGHLPCCCK